MEIVAFFQAMLSSIAQFLGSDPIKYVVYIVLLIGIVKVFRVLVAR